MNMNPRDWPKEKPVGDYQPKSKFGCITPGNTSIRIEGGDIIVRYHQTDIIWFNDDVIVFKTDGWKTVTTKSRMNQVAERFCLNFRVVTEDGNWVIYHNPDGRVFDFGTIVYDFDFDDFIIDRNDYL